MKPPALAIALALLVSGCVTPPTTRDERGPGAASAVTYDLDALLAEHAPVKAADGTLVDGWVFRPDTSATGEKVPVIINFSPYWSNLAPPASTGGDAYSKYLIEYYVPRGYAVALVSARGTGLSEGCFTIGGPSELDDEDAVATFFGQAEWSNGNVTATGKSYDGTMANGLLTKNNPHVRTIVPTSPISELYKYTYFDGVPYANFNFNTYYVEAVSLQQSMDPGSDTYEKTPTRICQESLDVQTSQYHSFLTGDYSPYWQARNYTALLPDEVTASVFHIHGLSDWNVKPDHMDPWFEALRARNVTLKVWLGDWEHEYPTRADFNDTLLRWFDHYLKGIDTGILDEPLAHVQDRDGVWRTESQWPPKRATPMTRFYLGAGSLSAEPGTGEASYLDATFAGSLPLPGAIAIYRSEPLAQDMRLAGMPALHVKLSSTGPRATLAATLLADGVVLDQGFRDLAHRAGMAQSDPMQPGQSYDVLVRFYPQDVVAKKGSILTLVLAHDPYGDAPTGHVALPTGARVTLEHGEGSFLALPLVPAAEGSFEAPQPEDVGCWAC